MFILLLTFLASSTGAPLCGGGGGGGCVCVCVCVCVWSMCSSCWRPVSVTVVVISK